MTVVLIKCSCGASVRLNLRDARKRPICRECRKPLRLSVWQRFVAACLRLVGQSTPTSQASRPAPPRELQGLHSDLEAMLIQLAGTAWVHGRPSPSSGSFLFDSGGKSAASEGVDSSLRRLYDHARKWAPGWDIPYFVPGWRPEYLEGGAVGEFRADGDGWTSIHIDPRMLANGDSLWLTLAHEACHHFLAQCGQADRTDRKRNERMTDAAMFVCGFGKLVMTGHSVTRRQEHGYLREHFGYMTGEEYAHAHAWVIHNRHTNALAGMDGIHPSRTSFSRGLKLATEVEFLLATLRTRVADSGRRDRLLRFYSEKHPQDSEAEIVKRILDSLERDNR